MERLSSAYMASKVRLDRQARRGFDAVTTYYDVRSWDYYGV